MIAAESVSRPSVWTAYSASEAVTTAVLALEEPRQQLAMLQVCAAGVAKMVGCCALVVPALIQQAGTQLCCNPAAAPALAQHATNCLTTHPTVLAPTPTHSTHGTW